MRISGLRFRTGQGLWYGPLKRVTPWTLVLLIVMFAPCASGVTPATLVDTRLDTESVHLAAVRDDLVIYFDADRRLREAPLRDFVQIRSIGEPAGSPTSGEETGRIELVDGVSLPGQWVGGSTSGDRLLWEHPRFGELEVSMEDVVWLTRSGPLLGGSDESVDRIRLGNGDELVGFVTGTTEDGLSLIPDGGDEPIALPMDRIMAVRLANPVEPVSDADRVTLRDGTVLLVREIVITAEEARFDAALPGRVMERLIVPLDRIARIELTAEGARLVELGSLPHEVTDGGEVFGLPMPPRFEPTVARLHAPLTLRFELPVGATRFATEAALPTGPDASARLVEHADFELVIRIDGGPMIDRRRLNAGQPRHTINLTLPELNEEAQSLILELDAGADGPVFDRLELRHPTLLVEPSAPIEQTDASRW